MESGLQKAQEKNNREIVEKSSRVVVLDNNNIPQDVVDHEILSRLPVKSLLQFKAVSKLWHSTISDPSFRRRCPATSVFVISYAYKGTFSNKILHEMFSTDEKCSYKKFPIPASCKEYKHLNTKSSNSCNGMLLLSLGPQIFLLNPSTHYFNKVLQLDDLSNKDVYATMGLCYDESIGDYKAVVILSPYTDKCAVLVASLKEKRWTRLPFPEDFGYFREGPLLVNDRLHWTVNRYNYWSFGDEISYFNPVKNVFGKLLCPQPNKEYKDRIVGIGVLQGCLCIAHNTNKYDYEGGSTVEVVIMIMKEYGVAESWTSLFGIQNVNLSYIRRMNPLFTTDNGYILIAIGSDVRMYNFASNCNTIVGKYNKDQIDAVTIEENLFCPNALEYCAAKETYK